ncbi:MAG: DUF882 domain-containing protein [Rhodospirillales bacterium]|nr:DUF882 domain-containing protein [Rhodospirillales bacterium]
MEREQQNARIGRRRFIGLGLGLGVAATMLPAPGWAKLKRVERSLSFLHLHTGETLKTVYYADGRYLPSALKQINHLLRDYQANEVKPVSPDLLDLLFALDRHLGTGAPFEVLSAYRSAETNAMLSRKSRGVAKHSMHIEAKAVDIRIPGVKTSSIAQVARALESGGVGYYPRRNFVHIDVGDVRTWTA